MNLILTRIDNLPIIQPADDLVEITLHAIENLAVGLRHGDILVFTQKIISKTENRFVKLEDVIPGDRAKALGRKTEKDPRLVELILQESRRVLRARPGLIVVEHRLGFICANAGIDHSNVCIQNESSNDWVLLLPEDPDLSANRIRSEIEQQTGTNIGVLIIDSHGRAWRLGTVGVVIGISGVPGIVDKRGEKDLFGTTLKSTFIGAADELAAAASLVMGQAAEAAPIVHARGFPYELRESSLNEILRPQEIDLFR